MSRFTLLFAICFGVLFSAAAASAQGLLRPKITARIAVTGFYYVEHEAAGTQTPLLASPSQLGFGDLRLSFSALRWPHRRIELSFDGRVRATGNFDNQDYEVKFNELQPAQSVSARGYLGGPEFELRHFFLGIALTDPEAARLLTLRIGRIPILEGDILKIDGARLHLAFGEDHRFGIGLLFGGAPNPYSRSLLSDYAPPCGAGVAAAGSAEDVKSISGQPVFAGPCTSPGPQLSLGAGLTGDYRVHGGWGHLWGTVGLVGTFPGGAGDGGAIVADPTRPTVANLVDLTSGGTDTSRIYLAWTNHIMPLPRWDLFSNLVVDFAGSHGAQVTRAIVLSSLRLLADSRLHVRLGYSYMSSLAVDMFLASLLYNRVPNGTTLVGSGVVENNLTVQRTGRHEGRLTLDLRLVSMLRLYTEGRLRQRALLDGDRNSAVFDSSLYQDQQQTLAGDVAVGLRDDGSMAGLHAGLSYLFLQDFRARSHVVRASLGRTLWHPASRPDIEGLSMELDYAALRVEDAGAASGGSGCGSNLDPGADPQRIQRDPVSGLLVYRLDTSSSLFAADCFGRRVGTTHEAGLNLTLQAHRSVYIHADYRFTALLTEPETDPADASRQLEQPTVFGHAFLVRLDWRFERQLCDADEKRRGLC